MSRPNVFEMQPATDLQYSSLQDTWSSPQESPVPPEEMEKLIISTNGVDKGNNSGNSNGNATTKGTTNGTNGSNTATVRIVNGMKRSQSTHSICASIKDLSIKPRPFEIVWSHINFDYRVPWFDRMWARASGHSSDQQQAIEKQVLRDISGRLCSNELLAIVGPSGCGKTTLLHCLAGHYRATSGTIQVHGLNELRVSFMPQNDCLMAGLTARETLMFASRFQNARRRFNHKAHVDNIITRLGLDECADRDVHCLSGGQMKRVTIAQELLYPTNLLILDEVTSGLDASNSLSIIRLLKSLTSNQEYPMSIVVSIHQPSAKIFSVFDRVYAMTQGQCIYEGPTELPSITSHLQSFQLKCPMYSNVADFILEVANDEHGAGKQNLLVEAHRLQHLTLGTKCSMTDIVMSDNNEATELYDAVALARHLNQSPFRGHAWLHLTRSWLRIRRSALLTWMQLITYIILGVQLATFYGEQIGQLAGCPRPPVHLASFMFSTDSLASDQMLEMRRIQENLNFLLIAVMTTTFAALEITVLSFPMDAKVVQRDWNNGLYKVTPYFIGRTLADLPFQLSFVIIFSLIIYTLTGQVGLASWRFVSFTFIMIMVAMFAQSIGFIFGAVFMNNMPAAVFTAPLCIFPALLFSGFFSRVAEVPAFYKPMTYLSHFRFAFDAVIVTLYGHQRCQCDEKQLEDFQDLRYNQSAYVRDVFNTMFGFVDCSLSSASAASDTTVPPDDNMLDDLAPKLPVLNNLSSTTIAPGREPAAINDMANDFATKLTDVLNQQANFGYPVAVNCSQSGAYLMREFNLEDDDLTKGIVMLTMFVLASRLLCSYLLSWALSRR